MDEQIFQQNEPATPEVTAPVPEAAVTDNADFTETVSGNENAAAFETPAYPVAESDQTAEPEASTATTESDGQPAAAQSVTSKFENPPFPSYGSPASNVPVGNPITYSQMLPTEKTVMSKGLKVFALILAAVLLLTGACATGYYVGKNSAVTHPRKSVSVDLSAKPKKTDEMTAAEVYDVLNDSIVGITVYNTAGEMVQASGVIYTKDGYLITNDHIYAEISSPKFRIYTAGGKEYDADYVAGDQVSDLAVLKITSGSFTPAEFGNSEELVYGEHIVAIGRPGDAAADSVITAGIVSSTGKRVTGSATSYSMKMIQTDSAINPGSSGGALANMYGQVVGITSAKLSSSAYEAVGYSVPTVTVKRVAEDLIAHGKVTTRAKLGITYTAINSVAAKVGEYKQVGLYVASVSEDSDLYGKVQEGDIITHINNFEITDDDVILDLIEDSVAGDTVTVTVVTASGSTKTYKAVLVANVGQSSYSNQASSGNSSKGGVDSSKPDRNGGTFDFPSGE
ncbi:MAG: trypsin-like peptidase domain-containing protein [Clostridia bacterium]|nr:trypsin-like peptidase domain-containing protein [Clostridia bacterium]